MPAEFNKIQRGTDGEGDCAIVALAAYLGVEYLEVVRAAAVVDKEQGRDGLWRRTIQRVSARLGFPLAQRRKFDPDTAYGVLVTHEHAVMLREGFVVDRDMLCPWDSWSEQNGIEDEDCVLLVVKE